MPAERGFTLIEVLVAMTCSTVLFLALFSSYTSLVTWMDRLNEALARDENVDLAPIILASILTHAGNNRQAFPQAPVELQDGQLIARSDISGADPFPDGSLDDPFELLAFRHNGDHLQMKSGASSYQPMLSHVAGVSWFFESPDLLELDLESRTLGPGSGPLSGRRLQFALFFPNLQRTLFSR